MALAALALAATGAAASGLLAGGDDPVAVTLPTWPSVYSWQAGDGYAGWTRRLQGVTEDAYGAERGHGGRAGLWLWPVGGRQYGPGGAEWVLRAPGTTRIASARISFEYRNTRISP